jgi:serine/threonine-protein kinase RsbW
MAGLFHRRVAAEELAVRALLAEVRGWLALAGLSEERCGTVEIALAEALNNVVEHGYAGTRGEIALELRHANGALRATLRDNGPPLPRLRLPAGKVPSPDGARAALPEGGFGWFLIRSLTRELSYARSGTENRLTLVFDLANGPDRAP